MRAWNPSIAKTDMRGTEGRTYVALAPYYPAEVDLRTQRRPSFDRVTLRTSNQTKVTDSDKLAIPLHRIFGIY